MPPSAFRTGKGIPGEGGTPQPGMPPQPQSSDDVIIQQQGAFEDPDKKKASIWERLRPDMKVYFPKYVSIINRRLAIAYIFLFVMTVGAATGQFLIKRRYEIAKHASGEVSLVTYLMRRSAIDTIPAIKADLSKTFCASSNDFSYKWSFDEGWENIKCVRHCSDPEAGKSCVMSHEYAQIDGNSVFVPSFFQDKFDSLSGAADTSNYFVPGIDSGVIAFSHEYRVPLSSSRMNPDPKDLRGTSTLEKLDEDSKVTPVLTVLLNSEGKIQKKFGPGEVIKLTIKEIMDYAYLNEFTDQVSQLLLDTPYLRVEDKIMADRYSEKEGNPSGPALRLTGAKISILLTYTNRGYCQLQESSDQVSDDEMATWKRSGNNMACLSIKGDRGWITKKRVSVVNHDGVINSRIYHGFMINFESRGAFWFNDLGRIFDGMTTILIWFQIPQYAIYIFVSIALGKLSNIYYRVMHQERTMGELVRGLAARLAAHSSAFMEIRDDSVGDGSGSSAGLTRDKLYDRFRQILIHRQEMDAHEIKYLVEFIFGRINQKASEVEISPNSNANIITINEFCMACSSNEPLNFAGLVQIFNLDRKLGFVENMFNDDLIVDLRTQQELEREAAEKKFLAEQQEADLGDDVEVQEYGSEDMPRDPEAAPQAPQNNQLRRAMSYSEKNEVHSHIEACMARQEENASRYVEVMDFAEEVLSFAQETISVGSDGVFELRKRELENSGKKEKRRLVMCQDMVLEENGKNYGCMVYTGEWLDNFRHGYGIGYWEDGPRYEGEWQVGRAHGKCYFGTPDGASYTGEWRHGKKHGDGTEISADGARYKGQFKDHAKTGEGVFNFPDGSSYDGELVDNMKNGEGVYEWSSGQKYKGQWISDSMNGTGTYTWPDGMKYTGKFRNNEKHGEGVFAWADGKKYEGTYAEGVRHGEGKLVFADGTVHKGTFKNGQLHGTGVVISARGQSTSTTWANGVAKT